MAAPSKPIPALYTVYILRSTVRHSSLYIGSTPNPPRRLKQHNGQARGGAARTSRASLRPWEMVALVSGFPGMVAALKFEWALTNAHVSLHIPSSSRLTVSTQTKRNGAPRRPSASLVSVLSNLHLLLRVPSFARWPLRLHFFSRDVHAAWVRWCDTAAEPLREGLAVATDFQPDGAGGRAEADTAVAGEAAAGVVGGRPGATGASRPEEPWGIHALPLTFEPLRPYVEKGDAVFRFEREGSCVVCREALSPGGGVYALCPNEGCEGVGHVGCWSGHLLAEERRKGLETRDADAGIGARVRAAAAMGERTGVADQNAGDDGGPVLPIQGSCPRCGGDVRWGEMMRELTLRIRGQKEVEKLLRKKRRAAAARE